MSDSTECRFHVDVQHVFPDSPVYCPMTKALTLVTGDCTVKEGKPCIVSGWNAPELLQEVFFEGVLKANRDRDWPDH